MVALSDMNIIFQLDRFKSSLSHHVFLYLRMLLPSSVYIFTLTGILLILIIPSAQEILHINSMSLTIFPLHKLTESEWAKAGKKWNLLKIQGVLNFETEADITNRAW